MRKTNRANATEINKMPRKVRYLFIVIYEDETVSTAATFQTLVKVKLPDVVTIKVVDLWHNEVKIIRPQTFSELADEWRENYFDFTWPIPERYLV